jgi:hypothetical protein
MKTINQTQFSLFGNYVIQVMTLMNALPVHTGGWPYRPMFNNGSTGIPGRGSRRKRRAGYFKIALALFRRLPSRGRGSLLARLGL